MTEISSDTTCFIVSQDVEGPDNVLQRFKRLITLEQHEEDNPNNNPHGLRGRVDRLPKYVSSSKASLEELVSRFEQLKTETISLQSKVKQLRSELVTLDQQREVISKQDSKGSNASDDHSLDSEIKHYQGRIALFHSALGLTIKRTKESSNIQVVFRGCCAEDRELISLVTLKHNDRANTEVDFQLVKCQPPVTDIQRILELLRKTGDMRSFLLVLRHRFVQYFELRKKITGKK